MDLGFRILDLRFSFCHDSRNVGRGTPIAMACLSIETSRPRYTGRRRRPRVVTAVAVLTSLLWSCPKVLAGPAPIPWWDADLGYRARVTVGSGFYKRTDYLVRQPLSFVEGLEVNEQSLHVVEWDEAGSRAREIPSQLGLAQGDVPALCWLMDGETPTLTERVYFVYFDSGQDAPRPNYPPVPGADEPPPGNLLRNSGFEEADDQAPKLPDHWKLTGSQEVGETVRTDELAHSGRFSVKIANRKGGATSLGLAQDVEGLKPGRSYLVRGWAKITEHQSGGAGLTVWYTPAPERKLPGNNKTQAGGGGVTDWVQFVGTGVIYHHPDRGKSITVDKTLPGTAGGVFTATSWYGVLTAYFDDLELYERDRDAFAPVFVTVSEVARRPPEGN